MTESRAPARAQDAGEQPELLPGMVRSTVKQSQAKARATKERKAAEVNAWAAAGCRLDAREEPARLVEVAAAQRAQRVLRAMVTTLVVSLLLCILAAMAAIRCLGI